MKKKILLIFLLTFSVNCFANNFFVRAGAPGNNSGSDWNNAWTGWSSIKWASISAGDTVYVAGGRFSGTFQIGASGKAGSMITIQRVRSTDSAATSAAGWNAAFDSTVVLDTPPSGAGIRFNNAIGSYVTIDGRVPSGWVVRYGDNSGGIFADGTPVSNIVLRYINIVGPGKITQKGDTRAINLTPEGGGPLSNVTIQYCEASGGDSCMYLAAAGGVNNALIEYSSFHDAGARNAEKYHPNIIYCGTIVNSTFRYNKLYNIDVEGLFFGDPGNDNVRIYGNLFYQGSTIRDSGRGIEFDYKGSGTNFKIYNNTFASLPLPGIRLTGLNHAGCDVQNNIFWQTGMNSAPGVKHDYNFYSGPAGEAHGISNGRDPFVSPAKYDYHLTSMVGPTYPRKKGANLGSSYRTDMDGRLRGSDGPWDIGAFEYAGERKAGSEPSAKTRTVQ
jgi:hypothetical protein